MSTLALKDVSHKHYVLFGIVSDCLVRFKLFYCSKPGRVIPHTRKRSPLIRYVNGLGT